MAHTWTFTHRSEIAAGAGEVWNLVVTPEGINDEMHPWMSMSVPRGHPNLSIDNAPVGVPLGRAWLRLFGVVPFDYDRLTIAVIDPGLRFREESTMASMRAWVHDRTVEPASSGSTLVTDRISMTPRMLLTPAGPLLRRTLEAFFAHRHRRLAAHFARG